ncbi:MAG: oligosaccharide flippase family protein [Bacteroidia bacterium]|nr:oligosaccharide flippase family protein [Bacteroidia bacterium]
MNTNQGTTRNPIKQLAGQTVIYGMSSILGRFLNWLLVTLYTNIFLPAEYGIVTELYAYVTFLMIVMTYGMETGFFRFADSNEKMNRVYSTTIASLFTSSTIFIVLLWLFSHPIANIIRYPGHPEYVTWLALIVGLDSFTAIPFAKLRQQNRPIRFMVLKLVNIFINIAANLFFLLLCPWILKNHPGSFIHLVYSPSIGVGYIFISNLIASLATLLILAPDIFRNLKLSDTDLKLLKEMLIYSLPLLVAGFAGMINETLDRILLKYLVADPHDAMRQVGIYGANYKLSILLTMFIQAFRYAAEPFFFSHAKEKNSKDIYADVMRYFVIFGLLIFLGVMLYIDVVKYFIGTKYHEGLKVVPILLLANLCLGIYYNLAIWYKLNNMTKFGAYIAIFGAAITIVANILLIPVLGYVGSAWATFICYFLMMVVSYIYGRKYFPIDYKLKTIGEYFFTAMCIFVASILSRHAPGHINLAINSLLMAGFVYQIVKNEKPGWLKIKSR